MANTPSINRKRSESSISVCARATEICKRLFMRDLWLSCWICYRRHWLIVCWGCSCSCWLRCLSSSLHASLMFSSSMRYRTSSLSVLLIRFVQTLGVVGVLGGGLLNSASIAMRRTGWGIGRSSGAFWWRWIASSSEMSVGSGIIFQVSGSWVANMLSSVQIFMNSAVFCLYSLEGVSWRCNSRHALILICTVVLQAL